MGTVDTGRCIRVTLDMQLDGSADINDISKNRNQKAWTCYGFPSTGDASSNGVLPLSGLSVLYWVLRNLSGNPLHAIIPANCTCYNPHVSSLRLKTPCCVSGGGHNIFW